MEVYLRPANLFVAQFIGSPVMNVLPARMQQDGGEARVVLADHQTGFPFRGALPEPDAAANGFMLGVRPEAVMVSLAAKPGFEPIEAHIIEPLGAYDIVDLKLGSQFLRARTPSGFIAGPGTTVWAKLDEAQTHFFDADTGLALTRRERH
jgi:multiple sugar transport system ATP-binding protein